MRSADLDSGGGSRAGAALTAIAAILMLMWPALINGQPFFFSDTSSYIRAGDMAARLIGGPSVRTIWSPPEAAPPPRPGALPGAADASAKVGVRGNDPASGYIMAGRSPYFGVLLWLGWVTSRFWLFVAAQAAAAYFLIGTALRCFGIERTGPKLLAVATLALLSPLALYNGLLMADALAGFGIAAFLILLAPSVRFARWEIALLVLIVMLAVVSHLTHIVMLAAMLGVVAVLAVLKWLPWRQVARGMSIGVAALVLGIVSIVATSVVVKAHYGKAPVLVPLITARFIADGPGRDFIEAGCDGRRFAVCRIPYRGWASSTDFLWSRDPKTGAFLLADVNTRQTMSAEDKAFAAAVAKAYPLRILTNAFWNSLLQVTDLRVDIVDEKCFGTPACIGDQFPAPIVAEIASTPSGRNAWPLTAMNRIMYIGAVASLVALAVLLPGLRISAPAAARLIGLWLLLVVTATATNGFLGGAISEPQSRYETRMAWLLPLLALIAFLVSRARAPALREGSGA